MNIKKLGAGAMALALCAVSAGADFHETDISKYISAASVSDPSAIDADSVLSSFTDDDITDSGSINEEFSFKIYSDTILVVEGSGSVPDCSEDFSFTEKTGIKYLIFKGDISSVGDYSFAGFSDLTTVFLPDTLITIGNNAFENCSDLSVLHLPESLSHIGSHAFEGCNSISELIIPDSVDYIGNAAFASCTGLERVHLGNNIDKISLDPNDLYCISANAFYNSNNISEISMKALDSNYDIIKENGIVYSLFSFNQGADYSPVLALDKVEITSGVYIASNYFRNVSSLKNVSLPDSVTTIDWYAFSGCSQITDLKFPKQLYQIGSYAFENCTGLTSLNLPDNLSYIMEGAFAGCSGISELIIPDSVAHIGNTAFASCTGLERVHLGNNISKISLDPNELYCISANAFYNSNNISEISMKALDSNYDIIKENGIVYSLFNFDQGADYSPVLALDNVEITSGDYIAGGYFMNIPSLKSVSLPDSVTTIDWYAFSGCSQITDLKFPEQLYQIGRYAFENCTGLTSLNLPDNDLTYINECAFAGCSGISELIIPDSVIYIGNSAFASCTGLERVHLGNNIDKISLDPDDAYCILTNTFYNSNNISEISMKALNSSSNVINENGIVYSLFSFDQGADYSPVPALDNVVIFNGNSLSQGALKNIDSLKTIVLPESLSEIGDYSFDTCSNLSTVKFCGSKEEWENVKYNPETNKYLAQAEIIFDYQYDTAIPGDVNCDGIVDLSDLTMLSMYLLKDCDLTGKSLISADVLHDGEIDIADLATLKQIIMHAL